MNGKSVKSGPGLQTHKTWDGADNRYLPRWEVDSRVVCRCGKNEDPYECRTMDLSCAGVCLVAREDLSDKRRIRMEIFLTPETVVKLEGHVVWSKGADYGNVLGIHFDNATQPIQELILQHAFEVHQANLVKHWFEGWNDAPAQRPGIQASGRRSHTV